MGEEHERLKSDLLLAQRRIDGLQAALNTGSEIDEDEDRMKDLSDLDEEETESAINATDNQNDSSEQPSLIPEISSTNEWFYHCYTRRILHLISKHLTTLYSGSRG